MWLIYRILNKEQLTSYLWPFKCSTTGAIYLRYNKIFRGGIRVIIYACPCYRIIQSMAYQKTYDFLKHGYMLRKGFMVIIFSPNLLE